LEKRAYGSKKGLGLVEEISSSKFQGGESPVKKFVPDLQDQFNNSKSLAINLKSFFIYNS
jgi:hypothetical protein